VTDPLTSMKESHFLAVHLSVYHCYLFRFMSDYHCVVHQRSFGGGVGSQTVASLGDFAGFFVHLLGSSDSITVGVSMHALQWPTSVSLCHVTAFSFCNCTSAQLHNWNWPKGFRILLRVSSHLDSQVFR